MSKFLVSPRSRSYESDLCLTRLPPAFCTAQHTRRPGEGRDPFSKPQAADQWVPALRRQADVLFVPSPTPGRVADIGRYFVGGLSGAPRSSSTRSPPDAGPP